MTSKKPSASVLLISGGVAGCVAKTAVAPLDRIKIHFQVLTPPFSRFTSQFRGIFDALYYIQNKEGVSGLFRGHSATLLRIFPYSAINFYSYEMGKRYLSRGNDFSWWKRFCTGAFAGVTAVTITYPLDILRVRMAYEMGISGKNSERPFQLISRSLRKLLMEADSLKVPRLAGLYQGYLTTVMGMVPYAGASFSTYETLNRLYSSYIIKSSMIPSDSGAQIFEAPVICKLFFGMIAGAVAQTIAYPFDVIRRRRQLKEIATHLPTVYRDSTLTILRYHLFSKSLRELFTGLSINYLKVAPTTGISFMVYEMCKNSLLEAND